MAVVTQAYRLKYRRTKIIATLGPASDNPEVIKKLIESGVNMFRFNMSHGTQDTHARSYQLVRDIANELGVPVGVLVDLAGPKIRTGAFEGGQIELKKGEEVAITIKNIVGQSGVISSQYEGIVRDVVLGSKVLLDDGQLELEVIAIELDSIRCKVNIGGILRDNKGINLPGCTITAHALTEKDKEDVQFVLGLGVDYIALSFVKNAVELEELRKIVGDKVKIIAKIETVQSLAGIDAIIDASDAIMIARGDLGAELPVEEVPIAQDQLITLAHEKMKPVIVATQMLETMIKKPRPTRAEVTDIAYAVQWGADAIMLSAETASGDYPVESVQTMDRIARQTEAHLWKKGVWGLPRESSKAMSEKWEAISRATAFLSKELMVRGVCVVSESQIPFIAISAARPASPIVAITSNLSDYYSFTLLWGVIPVFHSQQTAIAAREIALKLGLGKEGNTLLLVQSSSSTSPSITVIEI
ncbi:MAG: pyruvate kinase [Verrucomicrobia bacterium]|nr:pyruvate kinase [Verrucomicrobiota bacterium]